MAKRMPLTINGVDFTEAASRREYTIVYEPRTGPNSGQMLNGDLFIDLVDLRPVITWPLNALWSDELATLQEAVYWSTFVPVTYFDTRQNAVITGWFNGAIGEQKVGLIVDRGTMFHGPVLTLRSR